MERMSHVVDYDIPNDTEAYVHRIGRTGRAGSAPLAPAMGKVPSASLEAAKPLLVKHLPHAECTFQVTIQHPYNVYGKITQLPK